VQRRSILKALRARRDLSVADLESDLAISRFGLMKHLAVLRYWGRERENQPLGWFGGARGRECLRTGGPL
jgi:hypothetical protein